LDSTCARWYYEQGLVSQLLGWHDQAIAAFDRALELASGTPDQQDDQGFSEAEAHMRRGLSHYAASRPAAARADVEAARRRAPEDRTSAYLLGRIACETGDFASAQALLAEVVASDSAHPQAQFFLGRALLALGSHAEALAALERAAELRPGHAGTAALLSDAYSANGRHERALAAAAGAVRLDSGVAEYHQRLSAHYATVGRLKEARVPAQRADFTTRRRGVARAAERDLPGPAHARRRAQRPGTRGSARA
jgi:tetratricopeptide (TPR) repeat protein